MKKQFIVSFLFISTFSLAFTLDKGELLVPVKVFTETQGEADNEVSQCADGNLATGYIPGRMVESAPPVAIQFFFDNKATFNGMEIAQGNEKPFYYDKMLRIQTLKVVYTDGSFQLVKPEDTPDMTYYAFRTKRKSAFIELQLTEFYPATENWTCLLREIKFYGKKGDPVAKGTADVKALACSTLVENIFMGMQEAKGEEFPWFGRRVNWKVQLAHATWMGGQTGELEMNEEPVKGGLLDEEYSMYVRFDEKNSGRYGEVWYDAIMLLKNRLEWSKARKIMPDKSAWFNVTGIVVKPAQAGGVLLDEVEITDAKWKNVKEETLPVAEERYTSTTVAELEEYIFTEYNRLFTVFIEEAFIAKPMQHTKTLLLIGGRPGFAPGEWQPLGIDYEYYGDYGDYEDYGDEYYSEDEGDTVESFEETDYDEIQVNLCIYIGRMLAAGNLEVDRIRFSYNSLDYIVAPAECIKIAALDDKGESYFKILKYYDSIRERD